MEFRKLLEELDKSFLSKATNCKSFNLPKDVFQSTENKQEVRHLIQMNWFNGADITFYPSFNENDLKQGINKLKNINKQAFNDLFMYEQKGVGPGEVLTYFLFDDVTIGGGSSAGIDIVSSTGSFEMKAVVTGKKAGFYKGSEFISNFKIGGTADLSTIITELRDMKKEAAKIDKKYGKAKEVGLTHYEFFANEFPDRWDKVLDDFREVAYSYFSAHQLICLSVKNGEILLFGTVDKEDILMGNQTSGTIKPIFRIK